MEKDENFPAVKQLYKPWFGPAEKILICFMADGLVDGCKLK